MSESKAKMTGLGRSLGSLIPEAVETALLIEDSERIRKLAIAQLVPNPDQPRTHFDETALAELADSITRYGILQPLVASPKKDTYIIIAGERRWRAAQLAGLKTVPVIVRTSAELEQLEIALVENVQRVDLGPIEQAVSIERLHQQFNITYQSIAQKLGKAEATVSNIVRLLRLPEPARQALQDNTITEGHARQILALREYPKQQNQLLKYIIEKGWSVRQAEQFAAMTKKGSAGQAAAAQTLTSTMHETSETKQLSKKFNTSVRIHHGAKGSGRIELIYKNEAQRAELLERLANGQ